MWCQYQVKNREGREELGLVALILLAVVAVYWPSLRYGLLDNWDDNMLVENHAHLSLTWANFGYWWHTSHIDIYHPLTMFSYMFDYQCWGLHPVGFRLQSLFWHLAAVVLAYRCFRLAGLNLWLAGLGTAVFALHPQRVESVAWISERKDVLCTALYLGAVYCHLSTRTPEKFSLREFLLLALALLSKPMAVTLPVVLMLIDFARRQQWEVRYYLRRYWSLLLLVAGFVILASCFQPGPAEKLQSWSRMAAVVGHSYYWITLNSLLPVMLNPFYTVITVSGELGLKLAVFYGIALLLLGIVWQRRPDWRMPLLAMIAAYGVVLAPVAGFFHPGNIDYADRYSYLPSLFLLLPLLLGLQRLVATPFRRTVLAFVAGLYLLLLTGLTCGYLPAWKSYYDMLIWSVRHDGTHQMSMVELGLAECRMHHYQRVAELAVALEAGRTGEDQVYPESGRFFGALLRADLAYDWRRYAETEELLLAVYPKLKPSHLYSSGIEVIIYQRLIGSCMNRGKFAEAAVYIDRLLQWYENQGKDFFYYYYLGEKAALYHDWPRAWQCLSQAQQFNSGNREYLNKEFKHLLEQCEKIHLSPPAPPTNPAK